MVNPRMCVSRIEACVFIFSTALVTLFELEEAMDTRAPCSAANLATAAPIPDEPPITRRDWPEMGGIIRYGQVEVA